MPDDLAKALTQAHEANQNLVRVARLPREIGAQVKWPHNGLTWTRVAADGWEPDNLGEIIGAEMPRTWLSEHIARYGWELVVPL